MGLLRKLFGKDEGENGPASSQFHETAPRDEDDSEGPSTTQQSKNGPRRELVQVVLRDTMRQHGIPSDWMDCRVLSAVSRRQVNGMHVQLIVRGGHDELLNYVYAFQDSFMDALTRFEARAADWILSISWQFEGKGSTPRRMPDPSTWGGSKAPEPAADVPEDVEADLKALFAIRDAVLKKPVKAKPVVDEERPDFAPTRPGFTDSNDDRK